MNTTTGIALLIIVCIAGFILLLRRVARNGSKKDTVKLLVAFDKLEARHRVLADTRELMNRLIIGIDKSKRSILFIDRTRAEEKVQVLDLRLLHSAVLLKTINPLTKYPGKIIIECTFRDALLHPVQLIFYDEFFDDVDSYAQMERKAACWHQTIQVFKSGALVKRDQMIKKPGL